MNHMIDTQKLKSQITEKEWQLRLDLAATYRLIAMYGWDDLIYTHVSLRIPGPEHHFLINLYGLMFDEIEKVSSIQSKSNLAFDIVKYDDHNYEIQVALAGIEPKQIKINTVNDYLVLDVKNKPLSIDKDIIHKGIQNNSTKQVFRLEQNILVDEAELTNGILKIKLYKKDMQASPRRIIEIIEE